MAFAPDHPRYGVAFLAVASAATLLWFGTGLSPWWPLVWLAPLPVLLFAARGERGVALVAVLSWLLGSLNLWNYLHGAGLIPIPILVLILGLPAVVFALAVSLFRALLRRGAPWTAWLAFPAAWVSFEYLLDVTSPHGTAGSLSYSQLKFLPLLQLASLTGPWGMSYVVLLFSATLAVGLHLRRAALRQALRIVGAGLGIVVSVLGFGAWRLAPGAPAPYVRVGLVASDLPANRDVAPEGPRTAQLFRDYAPSVESLVEQGARVVVLPEKLGVMADPDPESTDAFFQALADKTKADIVVGMVHVSPAVRRNQARVYAAGAAVRSYDKHHMLPAFESQLEPGASLTLLSEPTGTWGVAICKDMDFTPLARRYGAAGTGLILVPAWDFDLDREWHGHMAVMRGVESGFSVARSARQGYLTVSDDRGRILAEARSDSAPFSTLVADVPVRHDPTLYLWLGDWFAWLALATLAFAVGQLYRLRKNLPKEFAAAQRGAISTRAGSASA